MRLKVSVTTISAALIIAVIGLTVAGCQEAGKTKEGASDLSGKIAASGSTTVFPLAQEAAEMFMEKYPDVEVNVQGGGSSVGIQNVSEGVVDIGNSSRGLKDEEKGLGLVEHKIALDVIAVITNKDVAATDLTLAQVKDIFQGKITNWKEVGGADQAITVVVRDEASGTREIFDEKALLKEKPLKGAIEAGSNGIVKIKVSSTPGAIGYVSLGYIDASVKVISLGGIEANVENSVSGAYPISRFLYMFTKEEPSELAKAYIDFILSDEFQNDVVAESYISIKATK